MLTAVFLHGNLGKKYGKKLMLNVESVAEAIGLLKANFPSFAKDVIGDGAAYRVWVGKTNISESELANPAKGQNIHIVPVLKGAGGNSNVFQIIVGIILVVVGVFTTIAGDYSGSVIQAGVGLIIGGVAGMVFAPSSNRKITMSNTEAPTAKVVSRSFSGPVNTAGQGNPVPILYGRLTVGSQVISGGLSDVTV